MKLALPLALVAALLAPPAAQAQFSVAWEWTHPSNQHPFCRIAVQQMEQEKMDGLLRLSLRNDSARRVRYSIALVARGSAGRQSGIVTVENANLNEISSAVSETAFRGRVQHVQLTLTRCETR
jgi:hypothetical protein